MGRTEKDVMELIEEINRRKLVYHIITRDCQVAAAAIGNYALDTSYGWQEALLHFTEE